MFFSTYRRTAVCTVYRLGQKDISYSLALVNSTVKLGDKELDGHPKIVP